LNRERDNLQLAICEGKSIPARLVRAERYLLATEKPITNFSFLPPRTAEEKKKRRIFSLIAGS
jgi:hypothetical protein